MNVDKVTVRRPGGGAWRFCRDGSLGGNPMLWEPCCGAPVSHAVRWSALRAMGDVVEGWEQ